MSLALVGVAALLVAAGLGGYFLKLEARGDRHVVVQILLIVLLAEAVFQPNALGTRIGVFRIPLGSLDARPADILVPLALAARALTTPLPRRISNSALIWTSFFVIYVVGAPVGYLNGNPMADIVGQLRGVVLGAGIMVLVAGIDVAKLVASDRVPRAGRAVGVVGATLLFTHFAGLSLSLDVPLVGFNALGALGADARTLFPILGVMAVVVELSSGRRRLSVILPSLALVATPIAATQGGPYLSLLVLLASLMVVAIGATWKRRLNLTAVDIGFVLALFLGIGATSIFLSGGENPAVVEQFEEAVLSDSQANTTSERYQLWNDALGQIADSPIWGGGVGVRGTIVRNFPADQVSTTFHNIVFDVGARSGLAGLGLLVLALMATFGRAVASWRKSQDSVIATLAMASAIGVAAIFGRALVSSTLEQTRVTAVMFILLGLILACDNSVLSESTATRTSTLESV